MLAVAWREERYPRSYAVEHVGVLPFGWREWDLPDEIRVLAVTGAVVGVVVEVFQTFLRRQAENWVGVAESEISCFNVAHT